MANELQADIDVQQINSTIDFELPPEKEIFIQRILIHPDEVKQTPLHVIVFGTDIELADVKRIEQATGKKMQVADLPLNLIITKDVKDTEKKKQVHKTVEPERGEAFHQKKASNNKDYNYSASTKAKMNKNIGTTPIKSFFPM